MLLSAKKEGVYLWAFNLIGLMLEIADKHLMDILIFKPDFDPSICLLQFIAKLKLFLEKFQYQYHSNQARIQGGALVAAAPRGMNC